MCQQTAGLVARVLEEHGIATVTLTLMKDVAQSVKPPRSIFLRFPFGSPMGKPGDTTNQIKVLKTALEALEKIETPASIIETEIKY